MKKVKLLFMIGIYMMLNMNLYSQDFKVLQIGDTIPEAFYKEVEKLGSAGKLFSESKGKLVILDFWSTYCSTCIESFPKMKALQDEFGDEIQVFLVNGSEDSLQITERMKIPALQRYKVDLPSISNAKVFKELFPYKFVPHHVWVDKNSVIQIIGSPLNANSEKIKAILNGEKVFSLKNSNNSKSVGGSTSLHEILEKSGTEQNGTHYIFSKHNNEYSANLPTAFESIYDSLSTKIKDTYVNLDVLELYRRALFGNIAPNRNKVIYSGPSRMDSGYWRDYFILNEVDTLQFTSSYLPFTERTDKQFVQSRFCYEQLTSLDYDEKQRRIYMLNNLNDYFGEHFGIRGSLADREVLCYVLKSQNNEQEVDSLRGMTVLNQGLYYLVHQLFSKDRESYLPFMIDETGLEDLSGLELPDVKGDYKFEDIISALNKIGIEVEQELRQIKFVLIKSIDNSR